MSRSLASPELEAAARERLLVEDILPTVRAPSRYLGCELNTVHKDPAQVALRVVLGFPDSYELGLGNLGLHILYHVLNQRPDVWAERVYAPAADLEEALRARGQRLFALESKTPLNEFDVVGFTLQWELTYTNLLNMLDLGGITMFAAERGPDEPLVIAGGPCVYNPEPLAPFIDAFVIGEGEEVVLELATAVAAGGGRDAVLDRLARIEGLYVPARYPEPIEVGGWLVAPPDAPRIRKRLVTDLDRADYPTAQIVPFTEQVHDRVSLEVLRGCTHGCRFCQAGMVGRPVRERSLDALGRLQEAALGQTGYEELTLVSLSTCDHSHARSMVRQAVEQATPHHATVSLPSLRLDSFSVDLAAQVGSARRTGLTFAPEAATDRLRAVINKPLSDEMLLDAARACYSRGFEQLKLYFMIGLPTETDEDVLAIADLAARVLQLGQSINRRAKVNLGVATFGPKPWTPFQWAPQISLEETDRRQRLLRGALPRAIKFGRHDAWATHLEGLLCRLDRRGGQLIYYAWAEGARMDGWTDLLNHAAWERAIERWSAETGLDPETAQGPRRPGAPLPWGHLDPLVDPEWLLADWQRAQRGEGDPDCRQGGCHMCGVLGSEPQACLAMQARAQHAEPAPATPEPAPAAWVEPPPVGRMRLRWRREGLVRLTSHTEVLNVFIRALRRAELPMRYSEGFHPHAELSFSAALPVGLETEGDWCDVTLTRAVAPSEFLRRLNAELPAGFAALQAWPVPLEAPALMATLRAARYVARVPADLAGDVGPAAVEALLAADEVLVSRRGKKRDRIVYREINIRPMIRELSLTQDAEGGTVIVMLLVPDGDRLPKADEVVGALCGLDPEQTARVVYRKLASYAVEGDALSEPRPPAAD